MAWDFSTDEAFEEQLAWMREFVREEVAPLEILWPNHHHRVPPPWLKKVIDPLKQQVKDRGLWACHLGPELGGKGFGQVKLSLMNEILAPVPVGADDLRRPGPGHRKRRDHRALRHPRAEGALPASAARR